MDSPRKHSNSQISVGQHHNNLSRSMFLKCSRHHYAKQYSRRNSHDYHKPSTSSFGKTTHFHDDRLCLTHGGGRYNSEFTHHSEGFREKYSWRPERITSSSSVIDRVSLNDGVKMVCGLCHESLRRKTHHFGTTLASEELSIIAVLVCGHIYHADCLEEKTSLEDKRDPPCPSCSDFTHEPDPA